MLEFSISKICIASGGMGRIFALSLSLGLVGERLAKNFIRESQFAINNKFVCVAMYLRIFYTKYFVNKFSLPTPLSKSLSSSWPSTVCLVCIASVCVCAIENGLAQCHYESMKNT